MISFYKFLGSIFKDLTPNHPLVNEHIKNRSKKIDSLQPEEQEKLDLGEFLLISVM